MNPLLTHDVLFLFNLFDGHLRLVGGCVRDFLLGRPCHDFDLCTPLHPEHVLSLCETHQLKAIPTGIRHGTITIVINKNPYEITTLRKDIQTDGRHALVSFTDSYEEDANRRDFTINALYMDQAGTVFDYVHGLKDLKNRTIRFIGDPYRRIQEDYLRLLRFFRFFAQLSQQGDQPDSKGLVASIDLKQGLLNVSQERKREELLKIIEAPQSELVLTLMKEHGILDYLLPKVYLTDFKNLIKIYPEASIWERLSVLTNGADLSCLKLPKKSLKLLDLLSENHPLGKDPVQDGLYRNRVGETIFRFQLIKNQLNGNLTTDQCTIIQNKLIPPFPISTADLLELGIPQGPILGKFIKQTRLIWGEMGFPAEKKLVIDRLKRYTASKEKENLS